MCLSTCRGGGGAWKLFSPAKEARGCLNRPTRMEKGEPNLRTCQNVLTSSHLMNLLIYGVLLNRHSRAAAERLIMGQIHELMA